MQTGLLNSGNGQYRYHWTNLSLTIKLERGAVYSQFDKNVWFLAGPVGGGATRTCEIPAGELLCLP